MKLVKNINSSNVVLGDQITSYWFDKLISSLNPSLFCCWDLLWYWTSHPQSSTLNLQYEHKIIVFHSSEKNVQNMIIQSKMDSSMILCAMFNQNHWNNFTCRNFWSTYPRCGRAWPSSASACFYFHSLFVIKYYSSNIRNSYHLP